ncbi:hypothetical protein Pedsa_1756 [Pseudopedobacter saltans DSM 12145]|uniref:DUF5723 domain-containing protein n=1 Tax=Pseudopedobacter saltans (strain ATCC 51119 / DSM 12145 / JCM 21818 / CCUG 39354 / LMG 10337 / NBRC 100064 / NCIMB 13643) TaxID=762903 RepID=F0S851_PSESL|nr:DUF5723 family protein [Pseudopedobacter saltans]ADY52313.1 hypothetical protein Pedsa_1756 [Pseudopedobacter saltans DSM 12145]
MRIIGVFCILISLCYSKSHAQDFSLTHTGTLYSSFENPVETSYTAEKSKRYNINFFLPSLSMDFRIKGEAETAFKSILLGNDINSSSISSVSNNTNNIHITGNGYVFMMKMLYTAEYQREMGISLQFKNEGNFDLSNTALVIPYSSSIFKSGTYPDLFNSNYKNIAYWQLGLSYRENYNSKLAFGGKLSLLSGAAYSEMNINSSNLEVNENNYQLQLTGAFTNSFGSNQPKIKAFLPGLKNPGVGISLGTSYLFNNKMFLTAHLKDAGIIFWNKKTPQFLFSDSLTVDRFKGKDTYREHYRDSLTVMLDRNTGYAGAFHTWTSSKIEFALSKTFDSYKPVLIASKNLLNSDGFIALQNNYIYRSLNLALSPAYYFDSKLNIGSLFMIKSANVDFYLGTEKLLPTYYLGKTYIKKDESIGKSPTQANIFFGLNLKFGKMMQTMPFADFVDGLNDAETGYVYRLSKKEKRKLPKQKTGRFRRKN